MKQPDSPEKYIRTRVRNLPVAKCLVNEFWQTQGMANVILCRRHSNGNLTAGLFLIDLLCLGVKDTFFMFNEPEEFIMETFPEDQFVEIDPVLGQNIVYAGLGFAHEYGIPPHKDFALTKYILEPDDEKLPVIDIQVGDESDGLPHLIVRQAGEWASALAALKRNAGEGGYHYTVDEFGIGADDDEDFDEEDLSDFYSENPDSSLVALDTIEIGKLTIADARTITVSDLFDTEAIRLRTLHEQLTIETEKRIRLLSLSYPLILAKVDDLTPDYSELPDLPLEAGTREASDKEGLSVYDKVEESIEIAQSMMREIAQLKEPSVLQEQNLRFHKILEENANDPARLYTLAHAAFIFADAETGKILADRLENWARIYPVFGMISARLGCKFPAALGHLATERILGNSIEDWFDGGTPGLPDYSNYAMLRAQLAIEQDDLHGAVAAYSSFGELDAPEASLISLQHDLADFFETKLPEI